MPLQGEYEPSPAAWVRDQVEEYESSGGTEGTTLRGVPIVVITSVGASSGKLRKNPVMRVEHDGVYAAVASKGGAPEHPRGTAISFSIRWWSCRTGPPSAITPCGRRPATSA